MDGSGSGVSPLPRTWLILVVGLTVGVAGGVLFSQSSSSSRATDQVLPPVTTLSSTGRAATGSTESVVDVEEPHVQLAEAELEPALLEERALELGLPFDLTPYAVYVGCGASVSSQFREREIAAESYFVGPLWFYRLDEALFAGSQPLEVLVGVEPFERVTLVVPYSERDRYSLLWHLGTRAGDGAVASGERAVTFRACRDHPALFVGGFNITEDYCAPLDVYFGDDPEPVRIILPFGGLDCPDGSVGLLRPEPGPVPGVLGLTIREARLAIRLAALVPEMSDGDPVYADGMVWAQEPGVGSTRELGTVVSLRTCRSGHAVVAVYQTFIEETGVTLSDGWVARSVDDVVSWYFISAFVTGGPADGQVATWILPLSDGTPTSINAKPMSVPANAAAQAFTETIGSRFVIGEQFFSPEDFGATDWMDFQAANVSQQCVAASLSR